MSNGSLFEKALDTHPLYVVFDRDTLDKLNANILQVMVGATNAGVKMFQIRSKQKDQRLLEDVQRCAQLASQNNCFLVINDYMDIATIWHACSPRTRRSECNFVNGRYLWSSTRSSTQTFSDISKIDHIRRL